MTACADANGVTQQGCAHSKAWTWLALAIIAAVILGAFALEASRHWGDVFDDAYISYRYAKHLGAGAGLRWNIDEPPTEGYTNFLLVVVLAPLIRLGADPLLVTRILSIASVGAMMLMLGWVARCRYKATPVAAVLIGGLILAIPSTSDLWLVGLETVIYSAVLLAAFMTGLRTVRNGKLRDGLLFGVLVIIAMWLRPEAALLFPAVLAACFIGSRPAGGAWRSIGAGTILLLLIGTAYLVWKLQYFGQLLPNPFYVKAEQHSLLSRSGMHSVILFFARHAPIVVLFLVGLLIGAYRRPEHRVAMVVGISFGLLTLAWFAHVDTLMDIKGRFLYPLAPVLIYLSIPAFISVWQWLDRPRSARPLFLLGGVVCYLCVNTMMVYQLAGRAGLRGAAPALAHPGESLMDQEHALALRLAKYPDIRTTRIAFADSGVIPYFTDCQWLDTVGLNDPFIARTHDRAKLLDYVFGWKADIMILPSGHDHQWIDYGHGALGNVRAWAGDKRWDDYEYVGTCKTDLYDLEFYVLRTAKNRQPLEAFLRSHALDGHYDRPPMSLGDYRFDPSLPLIWQR